MQTKRLADTIGRRVQQLMEAGGMTQAELARAIDIKSSSMSNIINDKARPSAETLFRIAAVFRANPLWILKGEGERHEMKRVAAGSETDLLDGYRDLTDEQKAAVLAVIATLRRSP